MSEVGFGLIPSNSGELCFCLADAILAFGNRRDLVY